MELFDGSPRERRLLIGMGAVVVIGIVAFLLLGREPAASSGSDSLDDALRDLQTVETALANRAASPANSGPREAFSRASLIRGSRTAGLTISRVEPGDDGAYTVTFEAAESPKVMSFLQDMTRTTSAVINAYDIEAVENGEVESRVTLRPQS